MDGRFSSCATRTRQWEISDGRALSERGKWRKMRTRKLTMGPGVRRLGTIRITSAQSGDNCFSRKGNGTGEGGSNGSEV
jgi:hypothetical protein